MIYWLPSFIVLLGTVFFLIYKYSSRNYGYWKQRNIPYIQPFPIFGSILPIFSLKTTIGEWLWDLSNKMKSDIFGIFIFDRPVLVASSSKFVKSILQKDFSYFEDRTVVTNYSDPVMANLLFFMKNPLWKSMRAKVSPAFTSGKLKSMFRSILHESEQMNNYISQFANVPNVEAKEISAKYSTNVVARCAFAVDAGSFQDENAEFRSLTREMFGFRMDTALRQIGSWFAPGLIRMFKLDFIPMKILSACKRIFREILHTRMASNIVKGNDLIDILIETNRTDGNFMNEDAMVGHATTFLLAGFETVSSTLSFALYELAIHPEMQKRLREEILEYTGKENGQITYSALKDMKYLDMVVSETLRKYPVLPYLDRICKADYKVEGTDLVIEKGMAVYIPMFYMHYNTKYFPDPEKFDPERFADKTKINQDGMYYIPFGEGPRICVGERFGLLGVKTGLASILMKFKLEKSDKTPIPIEFEPKSIVLQSKVGIPIKFVSL